MKNRYYIPALILFAIIPFFVHAQTDLHFSQFYESSILRNPALTGVFADDYKLGVTYRNQWSSITNPYQTALVSIESRIAVGKQGKDFFSFGLLAYYDKAGSIDHKILGIYPAVNFNKSLEDDHNSFLSVGFTGGYMQFSYDPSKATFNNQYVNGAFNSNNPTGENLSRPNIGVPDMGAGINFNSSIGEYNRATYVLGISGYHFTQPKTSFLQDAKVYMDTRINLNAALSKQVNDRYSFQLQGNCAIQGSYNEIIAGGLVGWTRVAQSDEPAFTLYGGVFYRYLDALVPTIKIRYKDFYFGFSYDVNVSTLTTASNLRGGFEITVYKTGMFKKEVDSRSKVVCPNFF